MRGRAARKAEHAWNEKNSPLISSSIQNWRLSLNGAWKASSRLTGKKTAHDYVAKLQSEPAKIASRKASQKCA